MDWSETVRKAAIIAEATGHITFDQLNELVPAKTESEDIEALMSASLIGHLGSSAFRPSTTIVSMSLAGSCFSSESAPRPFHHGIRRQGGTIFGAALPSYRQ
jgi:hypothetical protein